MYLLPKHPTINTNLTMKIKNDLLILLVIKFNDMKVKVTPVDDKLVIIGFNSMQSITYTTDIISDLNFLIEDTQPLLAEIDGLMSGEESDIYKYNDSIILNGVTIKTTQKWASPIGLRDNNSIIIDIDNDGFVTKEPIFTVPGQAITSITP